MDVTHYNADGTLDIVFGNQGTTLIDFDGSSTLPDIAHAIALQSDGRIIVAGETTTLNGATPETDFAICRLNTDGSLDSTFGTAGLVMTDMSGAVDSAVRARDRAERRDHRRRGGGRSRRRGAVHARAARSTRRSTPTASSC